MVYSQGHTTRLFISSNPTQQHPLRNSPPYKRLNIAMLTPPVAPLEPHYCQWCYQVKRVQITWPGITHISHVVVLFSQVTGFKNRSLGSRAGTSTNQVTS